MNNPLALPPVSAGIASLPGSLLPPKTLRAARDFEAQLLGSLLESLERTFALLPGERSGDASDNYRYLGTQAVASALSAAGGIGLARLIAPTLESTKVPGQGLTTGTASSPSPGKVPVITADRRR